MFDIEEDIRKPIYKLDNEQVLLSSIDSLREVLATTTPWEFFEYVANNNILGGLYPSRDILIMATLLRALQWRKHHRGKLKQNRNMIQIQFKSGLNPAEDHALQQGITNLKEAI